MGFNLAWKHLIDSVGSPRIGGQSFLLSRLVSNPHIQNAWNEIQVVIVNFRNIKKYSSTDQIKA